MDAHPLDNAITKVGLASLARELAVTPPAIRKWQRAGRLPRTEWTGETNYAAKISALCDGAVTVDALKGPWPKWEPEQKRAPALANSAQGAMESVAAAAGQGA